MNKQIASFVGGIALFLAVVGSLWHRFEVSPSSDQTMPHPSETAATFQLPLPSKQPVVSGKASGVSDREERREGKSDTATRTTGAKVDEANSPNNSMDLSDSDGKQRVLAVRRIGLENVDLLQQFVTDPRPEVRGAALARYRDLEVEYEVEGNIMRRPSESGRFVPAILENLATESDSFAQGEALDYLGEYGGKDDPNVEAALRQLLQRPDLSTDTLSRVGELLMDNYSLPLDQVKEAVQNSPSVQQLPESEANYLLKMLEKLNNGRSDLGFESTSITP